MSIILNILGGIFAGLFATGIYEWIRKPRLSMSLLPEMSLSAGPNSSYKATNHIRVINRPLPWLFGSLLPSQDAHSCFAWITLPGDENTTQGSTTSTFDRAYWERLFQPPTGFSNSNKFWMSSNLNAGQFIDIASGEAADIAIIEKMTGDPNCFILPWRGQIKPGKHYFRVDIGSNNSSHFSKWFILENVGVANNPNEFLNNLLIREIKAYEIPQYLLPISLSKRHKFFSNLINKIKFIIKN